MHWKRGTKKERKSVEWGSPKLMQPSREYPNPNRGKRKRGVCHKTGEAHVFLVEEVHYWRFAGRSSGFATIRCKHCKRSNTIDAEKMHRYTMHPDLIKQLLAKGTD